MSVCVCCNPAVFCCSSAESEELAVHLYPGAVTVQGVLRRKTVLKEGKKPTVRAYIPTHTEHIVRTDRRITKTCTVQTEDTHTHSQPSVLSGLYL